jgi:hypothetical protein
MCSSLLPVCSATIGDEALAHLGHPLVVIVLLVVGDLHPLRARFRDGIGHLEVEVADRVGREPHDDLVIAVGERAESEEVEYDRLLEREIERRCGGDRRRVHALGLAEIDLDAGSGGLDAVDGDARDARQSGVAQAILERQPHPFGCVRQAAERVELLQDERGDLERHADSSGFSCAGT